MYKLINSVINSIDEKYVEEASSCLPEDFGGSLKDVTINSEDLIEMKKQIKNTNSITKFIAIAAAFMCVAIVSVFLIVNNNKVPVLNSGTENSVISDPFTESTVEEPQISPEKQNAMDKINSLLLISGAPTTKFENENKENPAYIDYNGGKVRFHFEMKQSLNAKKIPDAISNGWYITVNGVLQNITVNGKEQGEIYIHRLVKGVDYNSSDASYSLDFEFEPVIAEADKGKNKLEISLVQISNPDFRVDPVYPECSNLHANIVFATRILNVNTELKVKDIKKSETQYTEELMTVEVLKKHPEIGFNLNSGIKAEIIDEDRSEQVIRADKNGEIKLGAVIVSGNKNEKIRLLFLVNGIPTKLSDGSEYVEIDARSGYLYEIKPDKILNVKPYDSIDVLIMHCLDESEKTHMSNTFRPTVIMPYDYGEYQNNSNTENSDTPKSEADEARENVTSLTLFGYTNNSSAENEYTENGKNYIDYTGEELVINFDMDISCDSDTVPDKMSMGFYILVEGVLQDTISVDGKEVKGVYIHYLTPEDFDARKKHNLKLKFSFTPKVAEVDKDKKELKVTLIRILHPHYKAVPGYVAFGPAIHSSSGAYGFTCKVKAPIEATVNDKISDGFSTVLVTDEVKKKYNNLLNDSLYESGYACVMDSNYKSDLTLDENGEIELGICVVSGIKAKYRLILLVNGIPTEFPDGSSCMELEANAGYLSYIEGLKFTNLKPYDSVGVKMIRCADGYPGSFSDMNNQKFVVKPYGSD
ncbi:MAG: hypothetical protein IJZ51_10115 [Ruminiclostridium sp.]|nr:hypothetical protein [Ruminiclostridium sp.]